MPSHALLLTGYVRAADLLDKGIILKDDLSLSYSTLRFSVFLLLFVTGQDRPEQLNWAGRGIGSFSPIWSVAWICLLSQALFFPLGHHIVALV